MVDMYKTSSTSMIANTNLEENSNTVPPIASTKVPLSPSSSLSATLSPSTGTKKKKLRKNDFLLHQQNFEISPNFSSSTSHQQQLPISNPKSYHDNTPNMAYQQQLHGGKNLKINADAAFQPNSLLNEQQQQQYFQQLTLQQQKQLRRQQKKKLKKAQKHHMKKILQQQRREMQQQHHQQQHAYDQSRQYHHRTPPQNSMSQPLPQQLYPQNPTTATRSPNFSNKNYSNSSPNSSSVHNPTTVYSDFNQKSHHQQQKNISASNNNNFAIPPQAYPNSSLHSQQQALNSHSSCKFFLYHSCYDSKHSRGRKSEPPVSVASYARSVDNKSEQTFLASTTSARQK